MTRERVADCFDIEVETLTDTPDDEDETKYGTLDESDVTTTGSVVLSVLFDGKMTRERVVDCFHIEVETLTDTPDDEDETKYGTLDESDVTTTGSVVLSVLFGGKMTRERVVDCFDIEVETLTDTSDDDDDDEAKDRTLDESDVSTTDAVAMAVLCDVNMARERVADCFGMEVETLTDTSDDDNDDDEDDEAEDVTLDETDVTTTDAVVLSVLCDGKMAKESVADCFGKEVETLTDTSDDEDEAKYRTLDESDVTTIDAVAMAVFCDGKMTRGRVADCFGMEVETLTDTSDNDDEAKDGTLDESDVTTTDAVTMTIL